MTKLTYKKPTEKSGDQYTLSLPKKFVTKMGINPEDREVEVSFNERKKSIIIKKLKKKED